VTACPAVHSHVVASARCAYCHGLVLASGRLDADDLAPGSGWATATEADPAAARICPATGLGHLPGHATATCADCGARLEAIAGLLWLTFPQSSTLTT
jgi:hypothetical protein